MFMDSSSLTIIEISGVAPSLNYLADESLPLTFFDSLWFHLPPVHAFLFYELNSADQTIIPNLKKSLSVALNYYYHLVGKLVLDSSDSKLEIRYSKGDSVPLTIAEYCNSDNYEYFARKNTRNAREVLPLIPHLPPTTNLPDSMLVPLLALQVTIFPKKGICIAFTMRHVACDFSAMMGFKNAWASIHKHGSDEQFLASGAVPFYDRSLIADDTNFCKTLKIQQEKMSGLGNFLSPGITVSDVSVDLLRRSFLLTKSNIENLKRFILEKHPKSVHMTSFAVTLGYVWSCLAKSRSEKSTSGNQKEYFLCSADCRTRLNPPLPETYFGNCVWPCFASTDSIELLGENGFINGAISIGDGISEFLHRVKGGEHFDTMMPSSYYEIKRERLMSVVGSSRFKISEIDFGWGEAERFDTGISMGPISLNQSKDSEGGLEISLSLPEDQMNAFSIVFADTIQNTRTSPIIETLISFHLNLSP